MAVKIVKIDEENQRPFLRTGPRPLGLFYALMQPWYEASLPLLTNFPQTENNPINSALGPFLKGVKKYHSSPYYREEEPQKRLWSSGRITAFHYPAKQQRSETVLLIPSIINKSYIFHLAPKHSLIEHMNDEGFNVILLDWGTPCESQEELTIEKAIASIGTLLSTLENKVHIAGYCMGGLLALAAAQLYEKHIKTLGLFATPWDFSQTTAHSTMKQAKYTYEATINALNTIPIDLLQTQFVTLAPMATINRFTAFADEHKEQRIQVLTLMEDWLADGLPLEKDVAHTIAIKWFIENETYNEMWKTNGSIISPNNIRCPAFIASAKNDMLVPEMSSKPLNHIERCTNINLATGHIGLMIGRHAKKNFYAPYCKWLIVTTIKDCKTIPTSKKET